MTLGLMLRLASLALLATSPTLVFPASTDAPTNSKTAAPISSTNISPSTTTPKNIDDCKTNPCVNGGTCEDGEDSYTCKCVAGYEGFNCSTDIDDCKTNPCVNGGTCEDGEDSYTCKCVAGYEGFNCSTDIDDCKTNPCVNGGTCEDGEESYTCKCVAGYEGFNCSTDIDDCKTNPCVNGGTCEDGEDSYTCKCVAGYEGLNCSTDIDDCKTNPCVNGGTCEDGEDSYTCKCVAGYEGSNCSTDTDDCSLTPCLNSGTCTDTVNNYTCQCADGYKGQNCSETGKLGNDCSEEEQLCKYIDNAHCNSTCQCKPGYVAESDKCALDESEFDGNCKVNVQCITPNASCIHGQCRCGEKFYYMNDGCNVRIDHEQFRLYKTILNSTALSVTCNPFTNLYSTCNIALNQTEVYEFDDKQFKSTSLLSGDLPSMTFFDLIPGRKYTLEVYFITISSKQTVSAFRCGYMPPLPPDKVFIENVNENSFTARWDINHTFSYDYFVVELVPIPEMHNGTCNFTNGNCSFSKNLTNVTISGLAPGILYTVTVHTTTNGTQLVSLNGTETHSYTRPLPLVSGHIQNITSAGLTVYWDEDESYKFTDYEVDVYPIPPEDSSCGEGICSFSRSNFTSFYISGLSPATNYSVSIYTIAGVIKSNMPLERHSFTNPLPPSSISIDNVTESEFVLLFDHDDSNYTDIVVLFDAIVETDTYICNLTENWNCSFPRDDNGIILRVKGLNSGHKYTMQISSIFRGLFSKAITFETYTVPSLPQSIYFGSSITSSSIEVTINNKNPAFTNWSVIISDKNMTDTANVTSITVIGLDPGTEYTVEVETYVPGFTSRKKNSTQLHTRPSNPLSVYVPTCMAHEKNVTVHYTWEDQHFNSVLLVYCSNNSCRNKTDANKTYEFYVQNLTAATNYSLTLYTVLESGLTSSEPVRNSSFTAPLGPRAAKGSVYFDKVNIRLLGCASVFDSYEIDVKDEKSIVVYTNTTESNATKSFLVPDLTKGSMYSIYVYARLEGIKSDNFSLITTYTRPDSINTGTIAVNSTSNTSITITWDAPAIGKLDNYSVYFFCVSPNKDSNMTLEQNYTVSYNTSSANSLDPGTLCNVTITTNLGDQTGDQTSGQWTTSSYEEAPPHVTVDTLTSDNRSLSISWKKPVNPNGVIRAYSVYVVDDREHCLQESIVYGSADKMTSTCQGKSLLERPNKNCSESSVGLSDAGLNVSHETSHLHAYRNYTVHIQAFTKCWGDVYTETEATKIGVPSSAPKLQVNNTSESTITLQWDELNEHEEGNGPITNYTIKTVYKNTSCSDLESGNVTTQEEFATGTMHVLNNLRPFWSYNVTIAAWTEAGKGRESQCENCTFTTKEAAPGIIEESSVDVNTSTLGATIKWSPPCRTNGIITMYTINTTNVDNSTHIQTNTTSGHVTQIELNDILLPYSNYTVVVSAYTEAGQGPYNKEKKTFRTKIGKPYKPTIVNAEPVETHWDRLIISWESPERYTGPTNYTATAEDQRDKTTRICSTGYNFNATNCTVNGLKAFWNYSVTLNAITDAGSTPSLQPFFATTAESVPGNVTSVQLTMEANLTKPRAITASWNIPDVENRNGIIINYFVICNSPEVVYQQKLSSEKQTHTFKDVIPGKYDVTVFAATKVGNGTHTIKYVSVSPGAPLLPEESTSTLLMREGPSAAITEDTKQISVNLPLAEFLCNPNNGKLVKWGVIVVSSQIKVEEKPFIGSITQFNKTVTRNNWFDVKDMDNYVPYQATPEFWKPDCSPKSQGHRRKRSATEEVMNFVVGKDATCSDVSRAKYCNGELKPGHKYRVKSFACTTDGCTETRFSAPISTAPNLTVPIAAGVSSAIVVIVVAIIGVTVLKRKQLACFKKDVESTSTHRPGDGIEFDRMQSSKRRPFTPGPIKLVDFPDQVEVMHKDSDLIFADAFKMLREKSPSHPMTASEAQCSRPKNRYTNILPFDHSRVKLRPSDDVEGSDYINANYIPGYTSRREYIATQGPMLATFDDFWRMVWEQNVDTIVMLTRLIENGRHKCDKYWPDLSDPVYYGDLVVTVSSESNLSDYSIRIIEIKSKELTKKVHQFSYLKWPDMGCPDTPDHLLGFVKNVRNYTKRERNDKSSGPMIVHCSAGVGRTGTFIAVDTLLQHIRDHDEVDIFDLVLGMRNHRLNMVQTEDQFVYIHECLKAFTSPDEDEPDDEEEEPVYVNTVPGENVYENTSFCAD